MYALLYATARSSSGWRLSFELQTLASRLRYPVPALARSPLDPQLRVGGDDGTPLITSAPGQPAAQALTGLADQIADRGRNLSGRQLGLQPVGR